MTSPEAHHRTIVVLDIANFTNPVRTATHQAAARDGLHAIVAAAFAATPIDLNGCLVEYRGDGALILVPPTFPKNIFASLLPDALLRALHRHNAVHSAAASVRLKVALHAGEVRLDGKEAVGPAVNLAFRILEVNPVRAELKRGTTPLAVVVSDSFYRDVVQQDPAAASHDYRRIRARIKRTLTHAWLRTRSSRSRISNIVMFTDLLRQLVFDMVPVLAVLVVTALVTGLVVWTGPSSSAFSVQAGCCGLLARWRQAPRDGCPPVLSCVPARRTPAISSSQPGPPEPVARTYVLPDRRRATAYGARCLS